MTIRKGHCLCGAVSFEYEGPENWVGHCHCESCRRNTSSAFTTFMGVPNAAYRFTGIEPAVYQSSPGVRRLFCPKCGAPVAYDADKFAFGELQRTVIQNVDTRNVTGSQVVRYQERFWLICFWRC